MIDRIVTRTQDDHKDKDGRSFPKYSDEYKKSLDFKIAGKSKAVDLTLSGDMLGALTLLKDSPGKIVVGFERGSEENARADGNIRGTYGQDSPDPSKARDFLGVSKKELKHILSDYTVDETKSRRRNASQSGAKEISAAISPTNLNDLELLRNFERGNG